MSDYDDEPHGPGPAMNLTLTVESLDTSGLYSDVVRVLADRLMGERWSESCLRAFVVAAVSQRVEQRLDGILAEGAAEMLTKPIQKRDAFGNAVGEPTDLGKIVETAGAAFLTEKVKENGQPASQYDNGATRMEWIVRKIVNDALTKNLTEEAKRLRAELEARAKAAVAELLTKVRP